MTHQHGREGEDTRYCGICIAAAAMDTIRLTDERHEHELTDAVRDALTDLRAAVVDELEALPYYASADAEEPAGYDVDRAAVLAEIDKRMPGGAP